MTRVKLMQLQNIDNDILWGTLDLDPKSETIACYI
jgi:hypothetical protein